MVCLLSFFLFQESYLVDYHLDLFLLSAILLFDIIYFIAKIVTYCKNGLPKDTDSDKINPEESEAERFEKKKNSYNVELEDLDN